MIYIAHLYYDLMNLYGEIGNIYALEKSLKDQGLKVKIDKLSIEDKIDINKYDFIYMGSGTESNQLIVLKDIIKYKKELKEYIESNKFILSTGNSFELFGKSINNNKALGIFNYTSKSNTNRLVGDIIAECSFLNKDIIGFINQSGIIEDNNNPMFKIVKGSIQSDGLNYNNFYGTYLLGPILVRNPMLHKYIINNLLKSKNIKPRKMNLKLDEEAYNIYMNTYHSN